MGVYYKIIIKKILSKRPLLDRISHLRYHQTAA